jgi:Fic family protein
MDIANARFVPPPPGDELAIGVAAWEQWMNAEDDLPLVVRVALGHYQFETLHPFRDGNGRVGRLVMLLQLLASGALSQPVLNLSTYLEAREEDYKDMMLAVSMTGRWDDWVSFIARGIEVEARKSIIKIDQLMELRQSMIDELRARKARGFARDLVDEVISFPVVSASGLQEKCSVSWPTANNAIMRFVELGFLRKMTGRSYGKLYVADAPLAVIEAN